MALDLFPRPRRMELREHGPARPARPRTEPDARLAPDGFVLEIDANGVVLRHGHGAGRRYGESILEQIREQSGERLPGLRIEDSPDFAVRGYMLDISRDRVPTRATLARLVELMAAARINHFELYIEHTFAYRDHETVWRDASPITVDDLAWLDAQCRDVGIDLVANQNCFGHMGRWLQHEEYRARAELPEGIELLPGLKMAPSTLAPTPENAAFALGLLDELLPNFASRRVHIGCDETFELGAGVSRGAVAARGKGRVYLDHVRRLSDPLAARGYEVLVWADVLCHAPELARELDPAVRPVVWVYEAPGSERIARDLPGEILDVLARLGVDLGGGGFEVRVAPLAGSGVPFWVAPGTSSWCSLIGRIDNATANLLDAADVGVAHGAEGYLITDWGDDGHLQPPSVSFGPLLFGGAVSWCAETNRDLDMASVLDRIAFADPTRRLGTAVVELGSLWTQTGKQQLNGSPLHSAVVAGGFGLAVGEPDPAKLRVLLERLEASVDAIASSEPTCDDGTQVQHELTTAAGLARHGAWRMLGDAPTENLSNDLTGWIAEQRLAWLNRARPGGLDDSIARLESTLVGYE